MVAIVSLCVDFRKDHVVVCFLARNVHGCKVLGLLIASSRIMG